MKQLWSAAMRAVAKSPATSDEFRERLLGMWIRSGDHVREEVGNDLVLIDGLWAMLPRYTGPALPPGPFSYQGASSPSRLAYALSNPLSRYKRSVRLMCA
jgi:hypothetical protein